MAPSRPAILNFLVGLITVLSGTQIVSGAFVCEELPVEKCAFAVSSSGARCVLEKNVQKDGVSEYKCQTSMIIAERPVEWVENEDCINSCGLQRISVGFSTDALLEHDFTIKLCLSDCRSKCPNINDLYTKLTAGEGIYLESLCDSLKRRNRRLIYAPVHTRHAPTTTSSSSTPIATSSTTTTKVLPSSSSSEVQAMAPTAPKEQPPPPKVAPTCTVTCTPAPPPVKSAGNLPYYTSNNPALGAAAPAPSPDQGQQDHMIAAEAPYTRSSPQVQAPSPTIDNFDYADEPSPFNYAEGPSPWYAEGAPWPAYDHYSSAPPTISPPQLAPPLPVPFGSPPPPPPPSPPPPSPPPPPATIIPRRPDLFPFRRFPPASTGL